MTGFVPGVTAPVATRGRSFVVRAGSLAVVRIDERPTVPELDPAEDDLYLGLLDGVPCFARGLAADAAVPDGLELTGLRPLYGVLSDDEFAVAGRALALTTWDADHRFCGRCGTPTERSTIERSRGCPRCRLSAYPRLSPAMICLVERDGKALLARNARFPGAVHSVLAGFVEVGETLEHCVARELFEEVGIAVTDVRYFGSQPWPFTNSLMIGFTARWAGGELVPDGREIVDAGWFGPDELPQLPPPLSIARALIDAFAARPR